VSGHPSAACRAQDRESTSAKDRRSTTELTPPTLLTSHITTSKEIEIIFSYRCEVGPTQISFSVCMSVGLANCLQTYLKKTSSYFPCMLPVWVAWSSSGGVATSFSFPVLWMSSCLYIMAKHTGDANRCMPTLKMTHQGRT